jgi:RNA polymerase sigma-70 factor (ECF subfamily)
MQVLVQRAQGGDRDAFGMLYEQLAPKIYRYVYHRVGRASEVAEDLASGVFLKLIEKLHRYEDRGLPFLVWVYRLAHNQVIDHFRAHPVGRLRAIEDGDTVVEPAAERAFGAVLTRAELTQAFTSLTAEQRTVVTLRFLQGLNIAETAALVGKSEDAVKKLQARGLAALRRALTWQGATREDLAA